MVLKMNDQNGIEFNVHVEYNNGATVSSRIFDVDAKKDLPKSIGNAVKTHLDKFNVFNEKIIRIQIDMRDI